MATLCNFGSCSMRQSLQMWAFERLLALNLTSGDLRLAVIAWVAGALGALGHAWFETIAGRAFQGAQFVSRVTAADTMVAAGRR